ncbi:12975_t:CDS:2 [Funneliformis geosporum]|uniref:12975_t:CDS:1 n=1 Tax=Funneliformis geosporum TaxID=1117311 RepID=A0A9W4WS83_9GLOM|nr:12975_t:CDS:2 [Funneliformis geosporum]
MQTKLTISQRFQNFKSSGSEKLDIYLKKTHVLNQQNPKNLPIFFIPLNEFDQIKLLRRGGEGAIYTANWEFGINGLGPEKVVLKKLLDKLRILKEIIQAIKDIHSAKLIHADIHSGNILKSKNSFYVSDLGLCREETKESSSNGSIFGVLPYVAPEVLSNNDYGPEADIYGFGIVAWEILSGKRPHENLSHDFDLIQLIISGLRPPLVNGVPLELWDLIQSCWNGDYTQRPTAKTLYSKIVKWLLIDKIYIEWDNDSKNEIENFTNIYDDNFTNNHFLSSLYDTSFSGMTSMQTSSVINNIDDNPDTRQIDLTIPNGLAGSQSY